MHRKEYQSATTRETKTSITIRIVNQIRDNGGRFLKQNETSGDWMDVGDAYAREKVSHALRSAKDPNRPKPKRQRMPPKYTPSPKEQQLFLTTLRHQQRIFQSLVGTQSQGLRQPRWTPGTYADLDEASSIVTDS